MSDWASGYNVEAGYTFGHYRELSPHWLNFAATIEGTEIPNGDWSYLELGCGYGFGLILLASTYPDHHFLGIDFNPEHIAHARRLAAQSGISNVRFEEADFVDLARDWPDAWGQFDYIVAHGIISWLNTSVRKALIKTIDNASTPGALIYLSYNALPGKITDYTIQHLLRFWQLSEAAAAAEGITEGVKRLDSIVDNNAAMSVALPTLKSRLQSIGKQDPSYLVHEYLHDEWSPQWFNEVVSEASEAKLSFVGSANISDLFLKKILPEPHRNLLAEYNDPVSREVMCDVLINQGFRKDIFSRGREKVSPLKQAKLLLDTKFIAQNIPAPDQEIKIQTAIGEVTGKTEVYRPILEALIGKSKSISELIQTQDQSAQTLPNVLQAVSLMLHSGFIGLLNPVGDNSSVKLLNKTIAQAASEGSSYRYLVASHTGQVLSASETELIMLHEVLSDTAAQDADVLWQRMYSRLQQLGKSLAKDGKAVTSLPEVKKLAFEMSRTFLISTLPKWKDLGIY